MTDTIVERVARALYRLHSGIEEGVELGVDHLGAADPDYWRTSARAAIAAIRVPTEAMVQEGYCEAGGTGADPAKVWQFMIDAALAQSE